MNGNPKNAMFFGAPYLQNEFGDPRLFYVFNVILSVSNCSESFKEICTWELLGANVLKVEFFIEAITLGLPRARQRCKRIVFDQCVFLW